MGINQRNVQQPVPSNVLLLHKPLLHMAITKHCNINGPETRAHLLQILGINQARKAEGTLHKGSSCREPYVWCNRILYQGCTSLPKGVNVVEVEHCMSLQLCVPVPL